jgi:hypothetical protein
MRGLIRSADHLRSAAAAIDDVLPAEVAPAAVESVKTPA